MTNIEYTHNGQTYTGAFDADAGWCLCDAEVQCDGCHDAYCDHDHDGDCGGEHERDCTCARQDLVRPHGERGAREYAYSHGGAQYRSLIDAIERARHMTTTSITIEVGRHTIDPQGLGSDEENAACEEHILAAVRDAFPGASVRAVGVGGRTSGVTATGEDITEEVRAAVNEAFDAWMSGDRD